MTKKGRNLAQLYQLAEKAEQNQCRYPQSLHYIS
jgi:hypothetical protein